MNFLNVLNENDKEFMIKKESLNEIDPKQKRYY